MQKEPSLADQFASETPQADRLSEVSEEMDTIRQFVDWLGERHIGLAITDPDAGRMRRSPFLTDLLNLYYGIDPVALEQERRALLAQARALSDSRGTDQS